MDQKSKPLSRIINKSYCMCDLCSRITALWRYINLVLLLLLFVTSAVAVFEAATWVKSIYMT